MPLGDQVGMSLALEMVLHSKTGKGRIGEFIQFDTMRGDRSTYTKCYDSSPKGVMEGNSFARGTGQIRPTSCVTQSVFLADFLIGAQDRMGYDTNNQMGLPIKVVVLMLTLIKQDAAEKDDVSARLLYKFGALIAILTAASLRGHEGLYLDLAGTRKHLVEGQGGVIPNKFSIKGKGILTEEEIDRLPYVTACLLGKFKGETGERYHSIILASNTASELKEDLQGMSLREQMDLHQNPVTRASRAGVGAEIVEAINRWRTVENAKGSRPKHNMRNHYTDARALAPMT
eukprot:scaffold6921_cov42-Cyclotella_meneghiniana.AAC.1